MTDYRYHATRTWPSWPTSRGKKLMVNHKCGDIRCNEIECVELVPMPEREK